MPYKYPIEYGKYLLTRRIAVGGMAEVFKAKLVGPRGFEKILAVKRILPEFGEDEDFVQMFVDEARISSTLHHGNIVQVYDFGAVENSYYIAMEYVDGPNLRNLFQKSLKQTGSFPNNLAIHIILQVARALDYAHNVKHEGENILNLVHRDISPQNVLISRAGEIKLTDFGIAKATIKLSKTQPGKVQGKLSYMSPEQATGRNIDRRSDIFSLGIIFYELLSGIKVYSGENTGQRYSKIRDARIAPLNSKVPNIPDALNDLIMSMLSKDPDRRPNNCSEVSKVLVDLLGDTSPEELDEELRGLIDTLVPPEKSEANAGQRLLKASNTQEPTLEQGTEVRGGRIISQRESDISQTIPLSSQESSRHDITSTHSQKQRCIAFQLFIFSWGL